jgi:hypothetical protein
MRFHAVPDKSRGAGLSRDYSVRISSERFGIFLTGRENGFLSPIE